MEKSKPAFPTRGFYNGRTLYEHYIGEAIRGACSVSNLYSAKDLAKKVVDIVDAVFAEVAARNSDKL